MKKIVLGVVCLLAGSGAVWADTSSCGDGGLGVGCATVDASFQNLDVTGSPAGELFVGNALPGTPAVGFTGVTTNRNTGNWSLGFQFTTTKALLVTALGFYDAVKTGGAQGLSGCTGCGAVGIFNSSGTLLGSTTVTTAGTVIGNFYYVAVTGIHLAVGQTYYAMAESGNADYTEKTTGFSVDPNINFIQDAFVSSATLAFPTQSNVDTVALGGGFFGANFLETVDTPEPSTFVLFGTALAGISLLRARRTKA
jgi:Domain of unknown function (DUF4082)/PEP-CTERM motif